MHWRWSSGRWRADASRSYNASSRVPGMKPPSLLSGRSLLCIGRVDSRRSKPSEGSPARLARSGSLVSKTTMNCVTPSWRTAVGFLCRARWSSFSKNSSTCGTAGTGSSSNESKCTTTPRSHIYRPLVVRGSSAPGRAALSSCSPILRSWLRMDFEVLPEGQSASTKLQASGSRFHLRLALRSLRSPTPQRR